MTSKALRRHDNVHKMEPLLSWDGVQRTMILAYTHHIIIILYDIYLVVGLINRYSHRAAKDWPRYVDAGE
jgi:hypothetical protein